MSSKYTISLKDTIAEMYRLLDKIKLNLHKTERGNKTAAQRTRTLTIQFAKYSKVFRKESVAAEKKGLLKKSPMDRKAYKKKTPKRIVRNNMRRRK